MSKINKEIICFNGNGENRKSYYMDVGSQSGTLIDDYRVILFPAEGEKVLASQDTEHSIYMTTNKRKASLILTYQGAGYVTRKKDICNDYKKFNGILIAMWHCERALDEYHMLFIDSSNEGSYRNISFETFGYERKDIIETLFRIISAPYLNVPIESVQDIKRAALIDDADTSEK